MASSTRFRTESAPSVAGLKADNADNVRGKALQDLHLKGGKNNIVQRTRDALGDIGNRLAKKNQVGAMGDIGNRLATKNQVGLPGDIGNRLAKKNQVGLSSDIGNRLAKKNQAGLPGETANRLAKKNEVGPPPGDIVNRIAKKNQVALPGDIGNRLLKKDQLSVPGKPAEPMKSLQNSNKENTELSPIIVEEEIKKPENKTDTDVISSELIPTSDAEKVFSQERYEITDIDAVDEKNAFLVKDYILDICGYLFQLEKKYPIRIRYLEGRLVNSRMRAVLLDWLVEVHYQFGFMPETLYMACKVMDRFLQKDRKVSRKQLQLVGITSMYVAAKFEEVCTPTVLDFSAVSDNAYAAGEIRQMERDILHAIGFDLAPPQAVFFLRRFSKAAGASILVHTMAKYIMELTLVDYGTCHLFPSEQAASSLALSLMIMNKGKTLRELWTHTLEYYTRIPLELLKSFIAPVASMLAKYCEEETPKLKAIRNKYARNRLSRISLAPELHIDEWKLRVLKDLC